MVKTLPATEETWVRSMGQEDPLKKGMVTQSSNLAWGVPWTEEPGKLGCSPWVRKGSDRTEQLTLSLFIHLVIEVSEYFRAKQQKLLSLKPVLTNPLNFLVKEISKSSF